VLLRGAFVLADGGSALQALRALSGPLALALLALGLVLLLARLSARSTVYTLTDKRVVMRIGIVLTVTYNLPLRRIASAGLHLDAGGTGDLPLALLPPERIAWLHLWPHARPWRVARPEPMLRCVPDAARVAQLLSAAWGEANGMAALPRLQAAAARTGGAPAQPAWAGH
jgi:hypothetical protein